MAREIVRVVVGPVQCNCYIVSDTITKQAYLIDPGAETHELMEYLMSANLELQGILITHAHLDHVGGIEMVLASYQAPVYYHAGYMMLYVSLAAQAESFGFDLKELQARQPKTGDPSLEDTAYSPLTPAWFAFCIHPAIRRDPFVFMRKGNRLCSFPVTRCLKDPSAGPTSGAGLFRRSWNRSRIG